MDIKILKTFDGNYNYFNCTGLNGKILHRREKKYNNFLLSEIVNENDDVILPSYKSENQNKMISFEDPRYINENEFSVSKVEFVDNKISNVQFKIYNISTSQFKEFDLSSNNIEKNWQILDHHKLIYHIDPWTIYNLDITDKPILEKKYDFSKWTVKYGDVFLSSNVFQINQHKFLFFHSKRSRFGERQLNYFQGILKLSGDNTPEAFTSSPYLFRFSEFNAKIYSDYYNWKINTNLNNTTMVDVFFINNVDVSEDNLYIYGGINDCNSVVLLKEKGDFLNEIKNLEWSLLF